jgi:hypothetical protein
VANGYFFSDSAALRLAVSFELAKPSRSFTRASLSAARRSLWVLGYQKNSRFSFLISSIRCLNR